MPNSTDNEQLNFMFLKMSAANFKIYPLKYSWNCPGRRATGYRLGLVHCFGNLAVLFKGT